MNSACIKEQRPSLLGGCKVLKLGRLMWSCLEFCCMLYTRTSFPQICVFISGDRQIFVFFTVLFMKWSQMVFIYLELFEIFRKKLRISGNIFRWFYVIFVSRPTIKISSTVSLSNVFMWAVVGFPLAALPCVSKQVISWRAPFTQNRGSK